MSWTIMETADDTLARLEQQLEKARKAVLAAGAELTASPERRPPPCWSSASSPSSGTLDMHKVRFAIDFAEKEPGADGCDADPVPDVCQRRGGLEAHRPDRLRR
ncbi:MAG: hypothetical protein ACLT1A_03610 [Dysosmobacter sp.]